MNNCPHCNYEHDTVTHVDGPPREPKPGDISLCISCGEISMFNVALGLSPIDAVTMFRLRYSDKWPEIKKSMWIAKQMSLILGGKR